MMQEYRLDGTKGEMRGYLLLTYNEGSLASVQFCLQQQLSQKQYEWLMNKLPQSEERFRALFENHPNFNLHHILEADLTTSDKIKLFCRYYLIFKGTAYKVSAKESGQIKPLNLTADLLDFYFKSHHWSIRDKQSISHLARYWNEINALKNNLGYSHSKFPDYYDRKFEQDIPPSLKGKYHAHLQSLGWEPVKRRDNNDIQDWKEPRPKNSQ